MLEGDRLGSHPETLIDDAVRDSLSPDDQSRLARHLAFCATCADELTALRAFHASLVPGPHDQVLDRAAIERVLLHLGAREVCGGSLASGPRDAELDRAAVERAMARLHERPAFLPFLRRLLRPSAGLAALGAAAIIVSAIAGFHGRTPTPLPIEGANPSHGLVLADGSEITPDDATAAIQVGEQTPSRTTVRLPAGGARFRIRHDERRLFRVEAGSIVIEDLGTVFRVAHETGDKIRVTVSNGRVAVLGAGHRQRVELSAGDDRVFPATDTPRPAREPAQETPPAPTPSPSPAPGPAPASAGRGQPGERMADAAALLQAADIARRSREPRAAIVPLRRLVARYPKDPRAPSAAFTLGWILLTDLNRPRDAAGAFAEAERIAPRGPLAEDAAARVGEAWQKAGDGRRAAEAARWYLRAYPTGRYITLMRGLIGER